MPCRRMDSYVGKTVKVDELIGKLDTWYMVKMHLNQCLYYSYPLEGKR